MFVNDSFSRLTRWTSNQSRGV